MNRILSIVFLATIACAIAFAADQTWVGQISDSMCGASHAKMIAEHTGAKMTERECALACVKGGGKYVFVSGEKVCTGHTPSLRGGADAAASWKDLLNCIESKDATLTAAS